MTERTALATTGDLAALLGGELRGPADLPILGVEGLDAAGPGDLTFIRSARYAQRWSASRASAALVSRGIEVPGHDPARRALLIVDDADRAMLVMLGAAEARAPRPVIEPGVHPAAAVHPSATIAPSASVGPCAVVGPRARVDEKAVIGAGAIVGEGVFVGAGTVIHPRVTLQPGTSVGRGCVLHPGVVLGGDGFGFLPGPDGPVKIPHLGGVRIGDGVEIGANTTIDRGKFADTTVGDATKIDNLVQVGHSCNIGRGVVICGCCAIAGSVTIGDGAMLGGHVAVRDNITVEPGAMIGGTAIIDCDITAGEPWVGRPARPASLGTRIIASTMKLPEIRATVRDLARRVRDLEDRA
jgi:UDP-3-O-[3-hydroxymyristoyl] glucosamine N-acyltransferase